MKKQLSTTLCAILVLIGIQSRAQLSPEQQSRVKATSIKFCTMMSRLAANPRDDEAFGALVEGLFQDAGGGRVYDDFLDGEVMVPFINYLGKVKDFQGQLSFVYSGHEYYYHYMLGLELGLVLVKKQVKGGRMQYEAVNMLVVDANTGKVREIGKQLLPGAVRFGQSPSVQPQQPSQPVVSTRPNADLPQIIETVYVEGGTFTMGCTGEQGSDCLSDEKPAHSVTVSSFYLAKTEVTQKQWRAVMSSNPSYFKNCEDCPVENVSWEDAEAFCQKLSSMTGQTWRFPTEAEWEFAARGGNKSRGYKFAGGNDPTIVAWYSKNSYDKGSFHSDYGTHPVGQKLPNELGLYDMSGNVLEWCQDWYGSDYYANSSTNNPEGPDSGSFRVLRGGSWYYRPSFLRVAIRSNSTPDSRDGGGFRPVRVP